MKNKTNNIYLDKIILCIVSLFTTSNIDDKLDKSASKITSGLFSIFTGKKIDEELLEELEELLISSDLGIDITNKVISEVRRNKYSKSSTTEDIKIVLSKYIKEFLHNSERSLSINDNIIGYRYCNTNKMMKYIKEGMDPKEAIDKSTGTYGRYNEASKYIDPRED